MQTFQPFQSQRKIKITAVSYLNTKPLLYGLFKSDLAKYIDLQLDIPSECARKLKDGEVDMGLVPVAIIPELENPQIISDFCIGSVGTVKTVCIYSDLPIEALDMIYLDYHSRTSVALAQVLIKKHWKLNPQFIQASKGYEDLIGGKTGGLVIGDRAIGLEEQYAYCYDLSEAWQDMTGLPFVFAGWVATKPFSTSFINQFNLALQRGIEEIPQLIYLLPAPNGFDLKTYYTEYISYHMDTKKRQALQLFLEELKQLNQPIVQNKQPLIFS